MTRLLYAGFILSCAFIYLPATAAPENTIVIPVGQQTNDSDSQIPPRGLSQAETLHQYGQPISKTNPTGTPPIEKWIYPDFSVIFENKWVIHSVINRKTE
jgi:hypothetical protein